MNSFRLWISRWGRYIPVAAAVVMVLGAAVVQGLWSDRWSDPGADARELVGLLEKVPMTIGDWEAEELPTSDRELRASGAMGHVSRLYRNRVTGERVSLFLICGHMRDVAVHTPDRCYPAAGFKQLGDIAECSLKADGTTAEFRTTRFRREAAEGIQNQRVFWTWGHNDQWTAPEMPRATFRGIRALYKMYLISSLPPDGQGTVDDSPCLEFGKLILPELAKILFPTS